MSTASVASGIGSTCRAEKACVGAAAPYNSLLMVGVSSSALLSRLDFVALLPGDAKPLAAPASLGTARLGANPTCTLAHALGPAGGFANEVTLPEAIDAAGVLLGLLKLCENENLLRLPTASLLVRRCTSGAASCAPNGKLLLSLRAMGRLGLFAGGLDAHAAEEGLELSCTLYTIMRLT